MGGCRCSYRNCTVRSDGKTHMFHYPVFDKIRCHQWLTNAQRSDFLDLKVSQLKNRVVCQNHFTDDNFMNYKKDKLKICAVPTEDGPYCNSSLWLPQQFDNPKLYPVSLEDIENECLMRDNRTNSMKYADFLTNSDYVDVDSNTQTSEENTNITNHRLFGDVNNITVDSNIDVKMTILNEFESQYNQKTLPLKDTQKDKSVQSAIVVSRDNDQQHSDDIKTVQKIITKNQQNRSKANSRKINIISEKKLSEPLQITGKLEPVSPSTVIFKEKRKKDVIISNVSHHSKKTEHHEDKNDTIEVKDANTRDMSQFTKPDPKSITDNAVNTNKILTNKTNSSPNTASTKNSENSLLKSKLSIERVAAIEQKRKFNMKLKDIIQAGLNQLEEQEKNQQNSPEKCETTCNTEKVTSYHSKESDLPNFKEYSVTCLEARMKRMEDILVNKIDINSQRVLELKKALVGSSKSKYSVATQTLGKEDSYKKYLYQEISQFLSPSANNLIYEELFINKYAQNASEEIPQSKRRRPK